MVKDLSSYIMKMAASESADMDLSTGELPVCIDADAGAHWFSIASSKSYFALAKFLNCHFFQIGILKIAGGGRFVSVFTFLNRSDEQVKLHPFVLFEGSDARQNLEQTIGKFTEEIRNIEGKEVEVGNKKLKVKVFGLFDLSALNAIIGKQNHASTYPCAWTNVSKDHLKSEHHKEKPHNGNDCNDIMFLSNKDFETNLTHHIVQQEGKKTSKNVKETGNVVASNLLPLANVFRYVPPLMHLVMGLTNDVLKELKKTVIKLDEKEWKNEDYESHRKKLQDKLVEMYEELEDLEAQNSNVSLAKMVILNDIKRVPLLLNGQLNEANKVALENYDTIKKKNKQQQCDAELCIIFTSDVENEWDAKFQCANRCNIHARCEGIVLIEEGQQVELGYECLRCRNKKENSQWLQDVLKDKNAELTAMQHDVIVRMTSVKSEIDHHEHIEQTISGPRQRMLKEAMLKLGDIARYHGGDMQGKQVQKMLDDARTKKFEVLKCVEDDENIHKKFAQSLSILANISDALRLPDDKFDDHSVEMITEICHEWGSLWPTSFKERNITPKGHILSFVLPRSCQELRTFYKFYKVEQKGESIHADFNDLERKAWVIKNKGEKLWKLIERYENRNSANLEILQPMKRVYRKERLRTTKYI